MFMQRQWILGLVLVLCVWPLASRSAENDRTEAPAGFDNQTNGFLGQAKFDEDREVFEEVETIEEGLGPVYNARSCVECHGNPITGGNSQITEVRAGHWENNEFEEAPGGSLIHSRAISEDIQELMPDGYNKMSLRRSTSVLGLGFVEAIDDETLRTLAREQRAQTGGRIVGLVVEVPLLEAENVLRVGRFGWKNQHASLISFSADAYLNEMGITSPMQPEENTSLGNSVATYDTVPDPEDEGEDIEIFANFIRATKVPPRDLTLVSNPSVLEGERLFNEIGCAICHVPTMITAPPDTVINGGTFTVPEALGNKVIHPYSDFLLHNIGTGDGIIQNGKEASQHRIRTSPLWGLRTQSHFMHDGKSMTVKEAIERHKQEAEDSVEQYQNLSQDERDNLLTFLHSL
jgi:CxxC motif-containing protein (DUF1111 family)